MGEEKNFWQKQIKPRKKRRIIEKQSGQKKFEKLNFSLDTKENVWALTSNTVCYIKSTQIWTMKQQMGNNNEQVK